LVVVVVARSCVAVVAVFPAVFSALLMASELHYNKLGGRTFQRGAVAPDVWPPKIAVFAFMPLASELERPFLGNAHSIA
jgi:hypothetical protein